MVLRRLRDIFGREEAPTDRRSASLFGLDRAERDRIGAEDDPLRGFEAAMERHAEAERAQQSGDPEKAIRLYKTSVAEGSSAATPTSGSPPSTNGGTTRKQPSASAKPSCSSPRAGGCPTERNAPPTASSRSSRPASSATGGCWTTNSPTPHRTKLPEDPTRTCRNTHNF